MRRNNQLSTYCTFNISYCPKKWLSSGPFLIRFTTSVRLNTSGRTLSGTTSCILISHVLVIPLLGFLNTETQKLINDFFPLSYNSADSNKRASTVWVQLIIMQSFVSPRCVTVLSQQLSRETHRRGDLHTSLTLVWQTQTGWTLEFMFALCGKFVEFCDPSAAFRFLYDVRGGR